MSFLSPIARFFVPPTASTLLPEESHSSNVLGMAFQAVAGFFSSSQRARSVPTTQNMTVEMPPAPTARTSAPQRSFSTSVRNALFCVGGALVAGAVALFCTYLPMALSEMGQTLALWMPTFMP